MQICDHLPKIKRYIESKVGPGAEAEDIYGETIIHILKNIKNGNFKKELSTTTYFYRCAQSTIVDHFKRKNQAKRSNSDDYECYINTFTKSPEKEYELREQNELFMKQARIELNDITIKSLILSLFQEMKHHEIANTLGIPRITVSSQLHRARKKLGNIHLNKTRIRNSL